MRFPIFTLLAIFTGSLLCANAHAWGSSGTDRGYVFVGNCNPVMINQSPPMQRALRAIAKKYGKQLNVFSCFRDSKYQARLRARNKNAANYSQHSFGVAADMYLTNSVKTNCNLLNSVRSEVMGGRGGIGNYGGQSSHFDIRAGNVAWKGCNFIGDNQPYRSTTVDWFLNGEENAQESKIWDTDYGAKARGSVGQQSGGSGVSFMDALMAIFRGSPNRNAASRPEAGSNR